MVALMYWDEIAEEIEKRVLDDLAQQYLPGAVDVRAAWKRHIIDVLSKRFARGVETPPTIAEK